MPYISVPFTNVEQEKTFWCWAAVVSNVYNSFGPPVPKSQCDVVTLVEKTGCADDEPNILSDALSELGIEDGATTRPLPGVVVKEFEGLGERHDPAEGVAEPVCAQINFSGGATHFVAITAIDTDPDPDHPQVWVADPYLGGPSVEFAWDDFLNHYYYTGSPGRTGVVQNLQRSVNNLR